MKARVRDAALNVVIVMLVALTLFQTGQLWLGTSSNHSFYDLFDQIGSWRADGAEHEARFASPYRIVSGSSDTEVKIQYSDIYGSESKTAGDRVITEFLRNGEFIARQPFDLRETVSPGAFLIYEYAFTMPAALFIRCFNQRGGALNTHTAAFDYIVMAQGVEPGNLTLYFVENETGEAGVYNVAVSKNIEDSLLFAISNAAAGTGSANYALPAEGALPAPDMFIPRIPSYGYFFKPALVVNAYAPNGQAALYTVEREVDQFFLNPIAKSSNNVAGVFTYSDASVVVKYYANHVLEYLNFKSADKNDRGLLADFSAALLFMNRDTHIINEYFLAGYTEEDSKRTFYFDYVLNDFKIVIPDALRINIELGMAHAIELTVEAENVTAYKKITYGFVSDADSSEYADLDFESLYGNVIEPYFIFLDDTRIQGVDLSYKLEKSPSIYLSWFIKINDVNLINPAQRR